MLLSDCPIPTAVWQFCGNNVKGNIDSPRNPCAVAAHIRLREPEYVLLIRRGITVDLSQFSDLADK